RCIRASTPSRGARARPSAGYWPPSASRNRMSKATSPSETTSTATSSRWMRVRAGDLARGFVHSCHDVLRLGQRVRARVRELAPDGTPWLDLQPFQADEIATIAE